ncbi:MAG: hypothetical protein HWN81_19385 [Candidatus Lokiarchaeota archaeon]|nr:hypothetical protein [Candidatus Lokiarchaeota archaeon]
MEYTVREDENKTEWYLGDKLHKENGPAVIFADGTQEWWIDGKRHREDGPAFIFPNGQKKYFIEGKNISEDDFYAMIEAKNAPPEPVKEITLTYTVEDVRDWLEDFADVVLSSKTGQIRWANAETKIDLWHLIQELEDENNGLHAFVNDLTEGDPVEIPNSMNLKSNSATMAGFFTFLCMILFLIATGVYFVNRFYG